MERIENPKVFISYAWGTQDYQNKVLAFASSLMNDGVDVLLDKWQLEGGNDMNTFMEKSVNDPSVTKVLLLLDENYAKKADERTGGVGTETQIISEQVYSSVEQNKFIPVVFERNEKGEICKPTYLQSRYHFDLSLSETYDNQYKMLIKALYGVESFIKPDLGSKPSWVDESLSVSPQKIVQYDSLKNNLPELLKEEQLRSFLAEIKGEILDYINLATSPNTDDDYINAYALNRSIRDDYLLLLSRTGYCTNRNELLGDFFEETCNGIDSMYGAGNDLGRVFIHELFIYTIAILLRQHAFQEIGYLLGRTYFPARQYTFEKSGKSFDTFYSAEKHSRLDDAVRRTEGKRYFSGTAEYWTSTVDGRYCSREEFVNADVLCYNYSVYGKYYLDNWKWFPITYIYLNEYNNVVLKMAKELVSKEKAEKYMVLFNYDNLNDFKSKVREVETMIKEQQLKDYRYPEAFESAPLIGYGIKASDIGTVR